MDCGKHMITKRTDMQLDILGFQLDTLCNHKSPFGDRANFDNKWVSLYARATFRISDERIKSKTLELARVEVAPAFRRMGLFTRVLDLFEAKAAEHGRRVFVESVLNELVANLLIARGYVKQRDSVPNSYWQTVLDPSKFKGEYP